MPKPTLRELVPGVQDHLAAIGWASFGQWSGIRVRKRDGRRPTYRPFITDRHGSPLFFAETSNADVAALLADLAKIAIGREPVNFPRVELALFPTPVLTGACEYVFDRLNARSAFAKVEQ